MEVRNLVKQAQIQLSRFRIIAEQRYAAFEQSGPGTGIDQSFDLLFEELLSHCSLMEKGVEECLTDDLRYSHNLYLLLAVLTVVLTLLVGLFVYRYRQRELKDNHALQESQQRFHRLSENAQDVIYRMSLPDGRYEYISSAATEIFGYTPKEFIATPLLIRKITHPDWQEYFRKEHEKLLTGEMPPTYEYQILHGRTGETRWLNQRNVLIRDPEGNPVAIEGIVTDITDRRQALERLAENQARFQGVFESMSSGVAVYQAADEGADFVFVDFNPAAEKIENISRDQVIGRRLTEVFPGVVDFGLLAVFQRVWRTGEPEQFPVSFYEDKRITGWRENYIYRLPGGEVVAVYDDLTEKKMAEQELIQHRDHLEELVGERTAELRRTVKLMAGRETRMADLKQVIVQLRKQLAATGISPLVDDPLRDGGGE
jgi:PAS domain S-box-containing protein